MKCSHCSLDSTYKERADGKCPNCKTAFALEPRTGDLLTDMAVKHAIEVAGSDGHVQFLTEHAFLAYCRNHPQKLWVPGLAKFFAVVIGLVGAAVAWFGWDDANDFAGFIGCLLMAGAVALYVRGRVVAANTVPTQSMGEEYFARAFGKYAGVHGEPPNWLKPKPQPPAWPRKAPAVAAEASHYSFDRAVICDRSDIVDVLLANDFHFENNCAILGADGHPQAVFEVVRAMLAKNPKLVALVLHDASPQGCRLAGQLRQDPNWFAPTAKVVDVGLRPRHAGKFANQIQRVGLVPVQAGQGIDPTEAQWLSQYRLSVAALRPEQLVKRLHAAFVAAETGKPLADPDNDQSVAAPDALTADVSYVSDGVDSFG